jgi:hypothetical protein
MFPGGWERAAVVADDCADREFLFEAVAVHLGLVARDAIG